MKQTVVFDFDGVIHSYSSGWKGETIIPDPPVDRIDKALKDIHDSGYEVVIVSTRTKSEEGRTAVQEWLDKYNLSQYVDRLCSEKPPAIVYIDDRAICFDGNPDTLLSKIQNFKPWNQKNKSVRYKTKPCEIEAIQWNGINLSEIKEFVGDSLIYNIIDTAWEVGKGRPHVIMKIRTLEGDMEVSENDYIIKGLKGEFYPCKPDIFEKKYELIKEE